MENIVMVRSLDKMGRVVIPKDIRNLYNLKVDDEVEIRVTKDGILINPKA